MVELSRYWYCWGCENSRWGEDKMLQAFLAGIQWFSIRWLGEYVSTSGRVVQGRRGGFFNRQYGGVNSGRIRPGDQTACWQHCCIHWKAGCNHNLEFDPDLSRLTTGGDAAIGIYQAGIGHEYQKKQDTVSTGKFRQKFSFECDLLLLSVGSEKTLTNIHNNCLVFRGALKYPDIKLLSGLQLKPLYLLSVLLDFSRVPAVHLCFYILQSFSVFTSFLLK